MSGGFADRVKETSTTTGTGSLTLAGAVAQFRSFNSAFGIGPEFYYAIVGQSGTEWEVGEGYLTGSTTMVRDLVYASSNGGAAVSFSAGAKDVFCTIPATEMTSRGNMLARAAKQGAP